MLQLFEQYLINNPITIDTFHPTYQKTLNEMLLNGGKRFRPMLLLAVVKALDYRLIKNALPVALAVECLHTYSLIHDDLPSMDNSPLRRGHATLHTIYGEAAAVLAGDALNTHAFSLLADAPLSNETKVELVRLLAQNGGAAGMVHGQAIDIYYEKKRLSEAELRILHANKTAKLIAACLVMGAVICDAPANLRQTLFAFGIRLGIFFQLRDDLVDVLSNEEKAGKKVHADSEKNSFVTSMGVDGARKEFLAERDALLNTLTTLQKPLGDAIRIVCEAYFIDEF